MRECAKSRARMRALKSNLNQQKDWVGRALKLA
jgi:hypothetical protein